MNSLPMTYNRDMQEDKEGFFDTYDTLTSVLSIFSSMLDGLKIDASNMNVSMDNGMLLATDVADYLVSKGLTFRDSYSIVSELSDYVYSSKKSFSELTLSEFKTFSDLFDKDIKEITPKSSVKSRNVPGGTSPRMVSSAIDNAKIRLNEISI
jgi:argininosuccinate lyase